MMTMDLQSLAVLAGMMLLRVAVPVMLLFILGAIAHRLNPSAS